MSVRVIAGAVVGAALVLLSASSQASPVPPACVVVNAPPANVQVGYAPNGPADCTTLP
jgi:hypothetical protein